MKIASFFFSVFGTVLIIFVLFLGSLPGLDAIRSLALGALLVSLGFVFSQG